MTPALLSNPEPVSSPASNVDELGEAIAELASRIHAATYDLLVMLREFDARSGWANGFLSCAHWLHWRTGIDLGAAREKVRVANALACLPMVSGAMQRGEVSYAKVRALSRVASPENEARLLEVAYAGTAAHVERLVRAWRRCDRVEETRTNERAHLNRSVTTYIDEDGMVVLRARLTPELGAIVQRALEAASDQLYEASRQAAPPESVAEETTSAQRRADALGLLAGAALGGGFDRAPSAERYQVVLHVDEESHQTIGERAGQAVLELSDGGVRVSAETSRRLACDASVVEMTEGADGLVLDVGRRSRTVPTAIRRALQARDARCRFPGCAARRCDAHHITHWADGGATALHNLVLLCRRHHRLVHEGGYRVDVDAFGRSRFVRPNGAVLDDAPRISATGTLPSPNGRGTRFPAWDGTRFNVAYAIDVLRVQRPSGA
jgi:hypothetical protein